ncbi:MAG: AAA family ATPase [Acidobacteria bacterium]|nr:AAA family ATPase [Acidobacteriota bacterium]
MVTRLYVDNFRCLVNFELKLDETNILLGPNGSGKTSVLDVLRRIRDLVARGVRTREAFQVGDLSLLQKRSEQRFELDLQIAGSAYRYALCIQPAGDRSGMQLSEEILEHNGRPILVFQEGTLRLYDDDGAQTPSFPVELGGSGVGLVRTSSSTRRLNDFRQVMAGLVIAGPCPPLFRSETTSEDEYLEPLMQNFVAWYRYAAQENMGAIAGLFGALGEALPGFESMDLAESGENTRALKVAFRRPTDERGVDRYGFGQLSDGQRMLIALYCLVFLSTNRRVSLFLDEPDNYLALREVQPWLAEVVGRCGSVLDQAVVASHHPVTIDYMAGAKGRWFYRDGNGPVRVGNEPQTTGDGISLSETVARGWDRE